MATRGVVAKTCVRRGPLHHAILEELEEGGHDLLVLGAPQRRRRGQVELRTGILQQLIQNPPPCPLLLVGR